MIGRVQNRTGETFVVIAQSGALVQCVPDADPTKTYAIPPSELTQVSGPAEWVSISSLPTGRY